MSDPGFGGLDPEALSDCVHCGLCLQSCPTYLETGREEESPRGRLFLLAGLAEGRWPATEVSPHVDQCLGCRACESACPSGVAYGRILASARPALLRAGAPKRSRLESWIASRVTSHPKALVGAVALYRALHAGGGLRFVSRLPGLPRTWALRLRLAPDPEPMPNHCAVGGNPDGPRVALLRGCLPRALYPATEAASARLLRAAGYAVEILDTPACCGALPAHIGETEQADVFATALRRELPRTAIYLVPPASGCGAHLKQVNLGGDASSADASAGWAGRVADLSELLLSGPIPPVFRRTPGVRVAYQDACHLRHGQGIVDEPRELLRLAGAHLVDLPEADICCGSAGTYNLAFPEQGASLGRRKLALLRASRAEVVVSANPGCVTQLAAWRAPGDPPVLSLARFLSDRLLGSD